MEIYVARQPVFTADQSVFGYELLFRLGLENAFPNVDGDIATAGVLANTFFSFGLDKILGGRPGLINFTAPLLRQRIPMLFPKEHIIIEVLENIEPDKEIINALKSFHDNGFRIALDDFVYHRRFEPMMAFSNIIKFDLIATPLDTLVPIVANIKKRYALTLLAEKVETHAEFEQARGMGFDLFQGYFFSKPEILASREISADQISKLKLVKESSRKELDLYKIETLIKNNISVSFKLLKFINSAYFSRPHAVNTIHDAITLLGTDELKKFINIVVAADLNQDKPNELIRSAVVRARMCEQCGPFLNTPFSPEELFTLGLFSTMDAILDMPMEKIMEQVSFSSPIRDALLGRTKSFRQILTLITSFERGQWDHRLYKLMQDQKLMKQLPRFYKEALSMADAVFVA